MNTAPKEPHPDPYGHLTDAQHDLYDRMSEISEDCFCAGWIYDNEYNIWHAVAGTEPVPGYPAMNPRLVRRCKQLATEVSGWIYWADGPHFVPMARWLAMVAAHRIPHPFP